jgi:Mechanosensitive ion channel, conserved TM helix
MWNQVNNALAEATRRVITGVANLLPGMLALILAVLGSCVAAVILKWLVERSLRSINFDARLDQWGMAALAEWSPSKSPTRLAGRVVAWATLLLGLLVGLSALEEKLASQLVLQVFDYLPNVFAALVLLFFGSLVARYLARGVLISAVNMQMQSARLLSLGVKWLVLVLTAAMALEHLRIGGDIVKLAFSILFGGIVLALALAVGLGSKEMVSRTWEKQTKEGSKETEETFHHF